MINLTQGQIESITKQLAAQLHNDPEWITEVKINEKTHELTFEYGSRGYEKTYHAKLYKSNLKVKKNSVRAGYFAR